MKLNDAAQILGLSGEVTKEEIKQAYRQAALKFHPDRNPAGAEMMKIINAAYDVLKDYAGEIETEDSDGEAGNYPDAVNDVLNAIIGLDGLDIEICGAWVWVDGETYRHRAARISPGPARRGARLSCLASSLGVSARGSPPHSPCARQVAVDNSMLANCELPNFPVFSHAEPIP